MGLETLDHVNMRTSRLDAMCRFYEDVLGLKVGPRPPSPTPGAYIYCGDQAVVHLVAQPHPARTGEPQIEHFAFRASGMARFLEHLRDSNVAYWVSIVPELEIRQVNLFDPDGNHIEVAFQPDKQASFEPFLADTVETG